MSTRQSKTNIMAQDPRACCPVLVPAERVSLSPSLTPPSNNLSLLGGTILPVLGVPRPSHAKETFWVTVTAPSRFPDWKSGCSWSFPRPRPARAPAPPPPPPARELRPVPLPGDLQRRRLLLPTTHHHQGPRDEVLIDILDHLVFLATTARSIPRRFLAAMITLVVGPDFLRRTLAPCIASSSERPWGGSWVRASLGLGVRLGDR